MAVLLKHQPWADGSEETGTDVEWNMWQQRQPPYHGLTVGSRIVLVSGGGRTDGMLTWEVEVTALVRGWYDSHAGAWHLVRNGLRDSVAEVGLTRQGFLTSDYTINKPDSGVAAGVVLAHCSEDHAPPPGGAPVPAEWLADAAGRRRR